MDWFERTALWLENDQNRRFEKAERKDGFFDDAFEQNNKRLIRRFRQSSQTYSQGG